MNRTLALRLAALERAIEPGMATLDVIDGPTPEQQATIDDCARTGRRLIVFFQPGDTAWIAGHGPAPWEVTA